MHVHICWDHRPWDLNKFSARRTRLDRQTVDHSHGIITSRVVVDFVRKCRYSRQWILIEGEQETRKYLSILNQCCENLLCVVINFLSHDDDVQ